MNYSTLLDPLHDTALDGLEFARVAFELFEEVYQLPDDGKTLRERRGDVKPLLEEALPIARYVLANYGQGQYLTVRWVRGSQPFDAKVEAQGGRVDHGVWPAQGTLEVTTAVHPNEYLMRERLNAEGGHSAWTVSSGSRVLTVRRRSNPFPSSTPPPRRRTRWPASSWLRSERRLRRTTPKIRL